MQKYDRFNPFYASIKERYCFNPTKNKKTYHIVLDIKDSDIKYDVGESVGITPTNDPELVRQTLGAFNASGKEIVKSRKSGEISLEEIFTKELSISKVNKKLVQALHSKCQDEKKKKHFEFLLDRANKEKLGEYLSNNFLWNILLENPDIQFSPQELCDLLLPILPRLYSIASSMRVANEEMQLIVAKVEYTTNEHLRRGVCTRFLCDLAPLNEPIIPIYVPSKHFNFTLPEDKSRDIIMVGPGAGIAPFRAFVQERMATGASGRNWLFFGAQNRATDFYYHDELEGLEKEGKLRLSLAFSRDQEKSIYVQRRMEENAKELWDWINGGANFYVCGNAQYMAKDVDAMLHKIISEQGGFSEDETKDYVRKMRADKRYMRDVY